MKHFSLAYDGGLALWFLRVANSIGVRRGANFRTLTSGRQPVRVPAEMNIG
jgi:hypothetical protein